MPGTCFSGSCWLCRTGQCQSRSEKQPFLCPSSPAHPLGWCCTACNAHMRAHTHAHTHEHLGWKRMRLDLNEDTRPTQTNRRCSKYWEGSTSSHPLAVLDCSGEIILWKIEANSLGPFLHLHVVAFLPLNQNVYIERENDGLGEKSPGCQCVGGKRDGWGTLG